MADIDFTVSSSIETATTPERPHVDPAYEVKNRVDEDLFQVMTALFVCEYAMGAMDALKTVETVVNVSDECHKLISGVAHFPDDAEALRHIGGLISQSITTLHRLKEFVNAPV